MATPSADERAQEKETFHGWRGSPALLTRVARASEEAVQKDGSQVTTTIDVRIEEDLEHFEKVDDFGSKVTPEALRSFSSLVIRASDDDLQTEVSLVWHRPWWKPGWGPDGSVTLSVSGQDPDAVCEARQKVRRTMKRGIPILGPGQATGIGTAAGMLLMGGGAWALLELLRAPATTAVTVAYAAAIPGLFLGASLGTWVWPAVEVAPIDRTRLRATLKLLSPVVLLILGAVVKKIIG
jgi:hypothetical protein